MGIIINDFEIILDSPQTTKQPQSQESVKPSPQPKPRIEPVDIEQIVRHFEQRRSRVRAD
ncbi:hypothetical protein [Dictyobacter formicarum]|uniref:Uncharacterized protein n=1 Tax=Dictyobacter formicarum TaxID=2778368 RepID=A0ABQ3VQM5_9CHLR|nr:hypothetical protein [Dictyobacter formicarum]GHO87626.1 hypothetical protein KSZ_56320 [Dictyobacter formicarum]